jgi:hypothetical protein
MTHAPTHRDGSHDFDFLTGRWRILNERLKERLRGCTEWEIFEAISEARLLPGGLGNIDHFFTDHWPGFVGMSVRLYDLRTRRWKIYWASNRTDGFEPPVVGSFDENGVAVFEGSQELDGRPIVVRFTWSNVTGDSARWEQAFSPDDGRTWEKNWIMTMTRIGGSEPAAGAVRAAPRSADEVRAG